MNTRRLQILLIGVPVLALCAGLAAGLLTSHLPPVSGSDATGSPPLAQPPPPMLDRTALVEELQLTPEQRDQMREIWEGVRVKVHQTFEDAQQIQKQRDDALVAILTEEQKAQFERISHDYADRFDKLTRARDQAFADAVERTKKVLNDEQRRKYEQILKDHVGPERVSAAGIGRSPSPVPGPLPTTQSSISWKESVDH